MYQGLKKSYSKKIIGNNGRLFNVPIGDLAVTEILESRAIENEKNISEEMDRIVNKIVVML